MSVVEKPDKTEKVLGIRMSEQLLKALEDERQRVSRKAGAEVNTSAVVRAILERALNIKPPKRAPA
jgi:hypothetical protein